MTMKVSPLNGKYVVAVSGGVDSVVLLDLFNEQRQNSARLELVVAHFDHGIRSESAKDRKFVEDLANLYGFKFYSSEGHLGEGASEELAREARYIFLNSVVSKEDARGLVTAHHQDDLIETAIINIIRGTGRKGLSSLGSSAKIVRPLLNYPKSEIIDYAKSNKLAWREDPTNQDLKYLRNYIRHNVVPRLDSASREHLLGLINKQAKLNTKIDKELADILNVNTSDNQLPRLWLNSLDSRLSQEVLMAWLRKNGLSSYDRPTIERLSASLKTTQPGKKVDVFSGWRVTAIRDNLALEHVER
jgi:tRNA(Ile)-lysidine synthetase-like protein